MKSEYRRDLKGNYLVIEADKEKEDAEYCINMIEQNTISGLLPFHRSRTDGRLFLNYEVTGKLAITSLFERRNMKYEDILTLLSGINSHLELLYKYLLEPEGILFDPQYVFTEAGRSDIYLCYAAGIENDTDVGQLAEFILKRLDHRDAKAVELGYMFYAKTQEENFSLNKVLKELLLELNERISERADSKKEESEENVSASRERESTERIDNDIMQEYKDAEENYNNIIQKYKMNREQPAAEDKKTENLTSGRKNSIVGYIFGIIHPVVLLSALGMAVVIELLFYAGYLRIAEAGGMFFLVLSVELIVNSRWRRKKEQKEKAVFEKWIECDADGEEYLQLQEEVYDNKKPEIQNNVQEKMPRVQRGEYIGETRCLEDNVPKKGMHLILVPEKQRNQERTEVRDIFIGDGCITIGKLADSCDILLESDMVSRLHARLECRQGQYYIKDLNSRNGTFLNGNRLIPQEVKVLTDQDIVSFADIQYRAVMSD